MSDDPTIVDHYEDDGSRTDAPGRMLTLFSDGSMSLKGGPQGDDAVTYSAGSWTSSQSAKDAFEDIVLPLLPMPAAVSEFADKCEQAAKVLGDTASAVLTGAAEAIQVADFAKGVGEALTALGALGALVGVGAALAPAGAAIIGAADRAENAAEGVLVDAWKALDTSLELAALGLQVDSDRSVTDAAKDAFSKAISDKIEPVANAVGGLLNLPNFSL